MEIIPKIIIFLMLLYIIWEGLHLFSISENEYKKLKNKYFPKLPYMVGKYCSLFWLICSISILEKMLFYPAVNINISLIVSALVVLIYMVGIFIIKKQPNILIKD
mgnify:CR=1 FL=1|tara:strand:- start:229 stop:543 length:315 start_codon:yes stop_codon:yes gene_type:complete